MMFKKHFGFDLGTTYMHICHKDKGVILNEPEAIAIEKGKDGPIAVGAQAYEMSERTPEAIRIHMPVKFGVIADFDFMQSLLNIQCNKLKINKFAHPSAIVCVPYNISEVERRALYDVFVSSKIKFKNVQLLEKPIAAGLGSGIDVLQPDGNLIVDIGGGTTEISVISLGGVVVSELVKTGGEKFDENIRNYIKRKYNVLIGLKTAEKIKKDVGSVLQEEGDELSMLVTGRNVVSGLPQDIKVTGSDVYVAIKNEVAHIIYMIKSILEKTPPELAADILDSGIYISGGTAHIRHMDLLISRETNLKVNLIDKPHECVINGVYRLLNQLDKHQNILFSPKE